MRSMYLIMLFTGASLGVTYGGYYTYVGSKRLMNAHTRVSAMHEGEAISIWTRAKETWGEAVKGGAYDPSDLAKELASFRVETYDDDLVHSLKSEGFDISHLNELRSIMDRAINDENPRVREQMKRRLREKFGLKADPALLAKLLSYDPETGEIKVSFSKRAVRFIKEVTGRIERGYDDLIGDPGEP